MRRRKAGKPHELESTRMRPIPKPGLLLLAAFSALLAILAPLAVASAGSNRHDGYHGTPTPTAAAPSSSTPTPSPPSTPPSSMAATSTTPAPGRSALAVTGSTMPPPKTLAATGGLLLLVGATLFARGRNRRRAVGRHFQSSPAKQV